MEEEKGGGGRREKRALLQRPTTTMAEMQVVGFTELRPRFQRDWSKRPPPEIKGEFLLPHRRAELKTEAKSRLRSPQMAVDSFKNHLPGDSPFPVLDGVNKNDNSFRLQEFEITDNHFRLPSEDQQYLLDRGTIRAPQQKTGAKSRLMSPEGFVEMENDYVLVASSSPEPKSQIFKKKEQSSGVDIAVRSSRQGDRGGLRLHRCDDAGATRADELLSSDRADGR